MVFDLDSMKPSTPSHEEPPYQGMSPWHSFICSVAGCMPTGRDRRSAASNTNGGWLEATWADQRSARGLSHAINHIVRQSQMTLRTLSLGSSSGEVAFWSWQASSMLWAPYRFPALTSLTINPSMQCFTFARICKNTTNTSLQYLDLVGIAPEREDIPSFDLLGNIARMAPLLTHLRLTMTVAARLERVLREWFGDWTQEPQGLSQKGRLDAR